MKAKFSKRKKSYCVISVKPESACFRLDDNQSIIHVHDRRMNTSLFESKTIASVYELIRAWVEDNPDKYNVSILVLTDLQGFTLIYRII